MIALILIVAEALAGAVCKDGWYSESVGPGTCSHHGGIAYLYEPAPILNRYDRIKEELRQQEAAYRVAQEDLRKALDQYSRTLALANNTLSGPDGFAPVLDSHKAEIEEARRRVEALRPTWTDITKEAARRELIARGLDPDDPHVEWVGDRRYDYLTAADRIYEEAGGDVKPATPEQVMIAEFQAFLQREADARGDGRIPLKKIERKLGKTLKGKALIEGIGFALALSRSQSEKPEDRKTQADLQREAEANKSESSMSGVPQPNPEQAE